MPTDGHDRRQTRRRGFTLAEATLAMVLLGIAAAGVLMPYASGASVQAEGLHRTLGAVLANDLIEQIVATPYGAIVDAYNYTESQGQLADSNGVLLTDSMYANFSRAVTCQYVHAAQQSDATVATFILATVDPYIDEAFGPMAGFIAWVVFALAYSAASDAAIASRSPKYSALGPRPSPLADTGSMTQGASGPKRKVE